MYHSNTVDLINTFKEIVYSDRCNVALELVYSGCIGIHKPKKGHYTLKYILTRKAITKKYKSHIASKP